VVRSKKRKKRTRVKKRSSRRFAPKVTYRLREIPIKQIQVWKDAQARNLDREGVSELARSIKSEGLLNPPLVQKHEKNTYLLMSGQRRLAAMKRLGAKKIPAHVLTKSSEYDLSNAKAASVIENIHRSDMDYKETAQSCKFLAEKMGKTKAARTMAMSLPTFYKYLGFAGVPDRLKRLVPKVISRDEATKLNLIVPNVSKAENIAMQISKLDAPLRKRYLTALAHSPKSSHRKLLERAKALRVKQKVTFKLPKTHAKRLFRVSEKKSLSPDEMAGKIITDYLKKFRK
jgi:ParB family transcriptional regulator, chromosome partitioning protein